MLSKERILEKTNRGLDIFSYFLPVQFRPGKNFLNPFYDDKNASCNIYMDKKNNIYRMKDFGCDDYSGDPFYLVGKIYGLDCNDSHDFISILDIINSELHLALENENIESLSCKRSALEYYKIEGNFSYTQKEFSLTEREFWNRSGIGLRELQHFHTISLKKYHGVNHKGKPFTLISSESEPLFMYLINGGTTIKIYRPFSKLRFLYGGKKQDYCFGLEQLPRFGGLLFITGGEKDVMTLFAHGYNAICFNSETTTIPKEIIKDLSKRFKYIILLYDVDKTGKLAAQKAIAELKEYNVQKIVLPLSGLKNEKDVTDYFALNNTNEGFAKLIENCLSMCSDLSCISVLVHIKMVFISESE